MMLAHVEFWMLEAAFRSLLMACAVWAVIRALRVEAVLAQKVAWVLVLAAAGSMPLVMRTPWLSLDRVGLHPVSIPLRPVSTIRPAETRASNTAALPRVKLPKPGPAHTIDIVEAQQDGDAMQDFPMREAAFNPPSFGAAELTPLPAAAIAPQKVAIASSMSTKAQAVFWYWQRIKLFAIPTYFAVAALLALRVLIGLSLALRVWHRSRPVENLPAETCGEPLLRSGFISRIRVSADLTSPVTIASTVILPEDYNDWGREKLRVVLAHEQSHVRQGDFYLQLLAALHAAVFWFSPLGWWLQSKISELGEALSDRAGLEQAKDPASYAQILLEFAALPRTSPLTGALTGVAMARPSNLPGRIERILNDRRFRLAFLGGRRHAVLTAVLVPAALIATVACVRIVPQVQAAQAVKAIKDVQSEKPVAATAAASAFTPDALASVESATDPTIVDGLQRAVPQAPVPPPSPGVAPMPATPITPEELESPTELSKEDANGFAYGVVQDGNHSFAIVHGHDTNVSLSGDAGEELEKAKAKYHDNFIWFQRDGKSYVITDPAIVAKAEGMFRMNPEWKLQQDKLAHEQAELQLKMAKLEPLQVQIKLDSPEFKVQMEKLQVDLKVLDDVKIKDLTAKINTEVLAEIQEKVANIQEQIGEIQGKIGERQGELGEQQGLLGEKLGKLGEQMGKIGEEQGRVAELAAKRMQFVIDQAVKDGKAQPVK